MGYKAIDGRAETVERENGILRCYPLPTDKFSPQAFVEGSREDLVRVADAVRLKYGLSFPGAVQGWQNFLNDAPQSDDAEEHIARHPLHIPFKEDLFGMTSEENVDRYYNYSAIYTDMN